MNLRDAHVKLLSFSEAIFPFVNEDTDEAIGTILESLDKLRWRDPNVELPEEKQRVLVVLQSTRSNITYQDDMYITTYENDYWSSACAWYHFSEHKIVAWLPMPIWEEGADD